MLSAYLDLELFLAILVGLLGLCICGCEMICGCEYISDEFRLLPPVLLLVEKMRLYIDEYVHFYASSFFHAFPWK